MTPQWLIISLAVVAALGFGTITSTIVIDWWKRKYPSAQDKQELSRTKIDFLKTYNDAQFVHLKLNDTLQKMVDEKTEQLQEILVRREMEHSQQIEGFVKKLAEETTRAEDYWQQLKDAKADAAYWKKMYEELKAKQEK